MTGIRLTTLLALSASALTLAACGSAEVASPGEGDFGGTGTGTGGGTTTLLFKTLFIGGLRFLSKPVALPELMECLDEHFAGHPAAT